MAEPVDHWTVLLNPKAGRGKVTAAHLRQLLDERGIKGRIESPPSAQGMTERVLEAISSGQPVAVAGGDGTLSLAIDALCREQWPAPPRVAMLPTGTACDFLRTFGISRNLEQAVDRLGAPGWYDIDVGSLEGEWGRRFFVNVAEAGLGAAAAETAGRLPRWVGASRYGLGLVSRLLRFPQAEIQIEGPRRSIETAGLAVIVANAQFFAWNWNIAPKANMVDNRLDLQVFSLKKRQLPTAVPKIVRGLHLTQPWVQRRSWESFRVTTNPAWPIEADGEVIGYTPVRVRSHPAAIRFKI